MNEAMITPSSRLCDACHKHFGMDCEPLKCEIVKVVKQLQAERDAVVAYLEELCDAFGNMTCGCECCPLNDSENLDEDGNALCKVWSSGLSLVEKTNDKEEKHE